MKKHMRRMVLCLLASALFWCGTLISDRQRLRQELIRLHVVANSDSARDQQIKLQVRDAVIGSLQEEMKNVRDMEQARDYLREKLPVIQQTANDTLRSLGCSDSAVVSLCREAFDTRHYDTFSLPAGVYEALRITIGEGAGENWWCVVYPAFCLPDGSRDAAGVAVAAGFPDTLNTALTRKEECRIRFALLDALGRLENILFTG